MAFLSWHDRYLLGHAEIDAQHKKLFELVNHFDDVIKLGMPAELGFILDDLLICAAEHFLYEEDWMDRIGYPKTLEHKRVHADLLEQLQQMTLKMKAGGNVGTKSVARFLVDWLTNHILREDLDLKPYLQA